MSEPSLPDVNDLSPGQRLELAAALRSHDQQWLDQQRAAVRGMTFEELETALPPGFDAGYEECDLCVSWHDCWHRDVNDRLTAVRSAKQAAEPGEIPVVNAGTARLAGDLLPGGVRVTSGTRWFNDAVEFVEVGDFLPVPCPLPGVLDRQDGNVEVLAKYVLTTDAVRLTVVRTNTPGATPTTYEYTPHQCVDIRRPGRTLTPQEVTR